MTMGNHVMANDDKLYSQFRVEPFRGFEVIARGFEKVQVRVVLQTLQAASAKSARRLRFIDRYCQLLDDFQASSVINQP